MTWIGRTFLDRRLRVVAVLGVGLIVLAGSCAVGGIEGSGQPGATSVRTVRHWHSAYDRWYARYAAAGSPYKGSSDSGHLAWAESLVIDSLVYMYEATGDAKYLDRAKRHIDADLATAKRDTRLRISRPGERPRYYYGWETKRYSGEQRYRYPYLAHDGMILHAIAHFVRVVERRQPRLSSYKPAADRYLSLIVRKFLPNWQFCWRQTDGPYGAQGYYLFPGEWDGVNANDTYYPPGSSVPYNMFLTYGRLYVELYRTTGNARYRTRAVRIGRTFKAALATVGNHYVWRYTDSLDAADPVRGTSVEDVSHANIDVAFMYEMSKVGAVFTSADVQRAVNTFTDVIYQGDAGVAWSIDGATTPTRAIQPWTGLWGWALLTRNRDRLTFQIARLVADGPVGVDKDSDYLNTVATMAWTVAASRPR